MNILFSCWINHLIFICFSFLRNISVLLLLLLLLLLLFCLFFCFFGFPVEYYLVVGG